jgi:catechol 2,3-dioxygenase
VSGPQGPVEPAQSAERPIDPHLRIGHVHLRTADIDRVRAFYVGILGFDVVFEARDVPGWGTTGDILFVSAGGYHHHLGFNTWKSASGPPQPATSRSSSPPRRAADRGDLATCHT